VHRERSQTPGTPERAFSRKKNSHEIGVFLPIESVRGKIFIVEQIENPLVGEPYEGKEGIQGERGDKREISLETLKRKKNCPALQEVNRTGGKLKIAGWKREIRIRE